MTMLADDATSFDHSVWTPDTEITLTNVSWNNDYRDVWGADTQVELDAYIDNGEKYPATIQSSYARVSMPIKLDLPFNVAQRYNYLRARNGAQPIPGGDFAKSFYYFILDVRMIAPNTTEVVVQIDVMQSFGRDVSFGQSYVERGHIGIANENASNNNGRDYLTIPEGIDTGSDFLTVSYKNHEIMGIKQEAFALPPDSHRVMIVSTIDLEADYGTAAAPQLSAADGGSVQGISSGAKPYVLTATDFLTLMRDLSNYPWVAQGIVSITMIPKPEDFGMYVEYNTPAGKGFALGTIIHIGTSYKQINGLPNWRTSSEVVEYIPERYRGLEKLFTSQYCMLEITAFNGRPLFLKPELWGSVDAALKIRPSLVPGHQRLVVTPDSYNARSGARIETIDKGEYIHPDTGHDFGGVWEGDNGGDYLDISLQVEGFPQLTGVNNAAALAVAGGANMLAYGKDAASYAQNRATRSNTVSYDQAGVAMRAGDNTNSISNRADLLQTELTNNAGLGQAIASGVGSIGLGAGGGAVVGGAPGAAAGAAAGAGSGVMSGISQLLGNDQNTASSAIRRNAANAGNTESQRAAQSVANSNRGLADWAARGDYENTIAGLNAQVQDTKLTPPSMVGQAGGEVFNVIHSAMDVSVRVKMVDIAAISVVGEYWLRYGYAVRRFIQMPASLHVMSKFTYWKLTETYVVAAPMPEYFKQVIRGIFEKGVTVWKNPDEIGQIDMSTNTPLSGVSF